MHAADLLSSRARLTPDREALFEVATGTRYAYAELNTRANRAANALRALGVQTGDRVAILAYNSVAFLDLLYGLAKIGAIFTPLNWRLTGRELAYIIGDCAPRVLIVGPDCLETFNEVQALAPTPIVIALDEAAIPDVPRYADLLAAASPDEPTWPPLDGETPFAILYTSGTTGRPKGAVLPHRQILWNAINTVISWGLTEHDVSPVFTPLFHAGGLFAFLTPILYAGGRIVLSQGFDAEATLELICSERCTVILGVPTLFQMWQATPGFDAADFGHVHFFISGGAPCPPALIAAWRARKGVTFRQGYGLTEVGVNCYSMTDAESATRVGSVGKPILHSEMRLADPETGADVADGDAGELLIRGSHVCLGYWRDPLATAAAIRDGWFHTGDSARRDADGFYTIVGRYKDMITSGGENVYAAEVEAVFREHAAVADAALIGQPDPKWGEVGLVIVMLKPGAQASVDELLALCQGRLARYKIPKRVVFDTLPYSPYGKVMKPVLRAKYVNPDIA
ncbi:MAG: AMP-binding protein [Anaerolineales bacterium]|nr:AMP-binding protein [Anaerolineales bacterium]